MIEWKTLVYLKVLMCGVGSFPDWGRGILQESSSAGWISLKPPSLRSLDETSRNPTDRLLPSRPNPTLTPPSYPTTSPSNHSPAGQNLEEDGHYCPKNYTISNIKKQNDFQMTSWYVIGCYNTASWCLFVIRLWNTLTLFQTLVSCLCRQYFEALLVSSRHEGCPAR